MDEKLKEEILKYIKNVEVTIKGYEFSLHSRDYIDVQSHEEHIYVLKQLTLKLKQKVQQNE